MLDSNHQLAVVRAELNLGSFFGNSDPVVHLSQLVDGRLQDQVAPHPQAVLLHQEDGKAPGHTRHLRKQEVPGRSCS